MALFWVGVNTILTGNIIDIVVAGHDLQGLWLNFGLALTVLAQNYPTSIGFINHFSAVVRRLAVELRNALTYRLQELSIEFHNRASSSVIQTKVVRDVENIELLLQQSVGPGLLAINVLIGALVTTAIRVPAFVPVFVITVPVSVLLVRMLRACQCLTRGYSDSSGLMV